MSDIVISAGVRSNLLNLQQTSELIATTQNRLATGKKVNSALDNPTNFFTASSLNSRANDLGSLLDGLSNGIKTLEAADNGLKAITRTVETLQSTVRQARQDKSFQTETFALGSGNNFSLSFSGGAVGATPVNIAVTGGTAATATTVTGAVPAPANLGTTFTGGALNIGGTEITLANGNAATSATLTGTADLTVATGTPIATTGDITVNGDTIQLTAGNETANIAAAINARTGVHGVTAGVGGGGELTLTDASGQNITVGGSAGLLQELGLGNGTVTSVSSSNGVEANNVTVDTLASEINTKLAAAGETGITASNDAGALKFTKADGTDLTISGAPTLLNDIGLSVGNVNSVTSDNGSQATGAPTVDDLVSAVNNNDDLKGKVRASNVNGQLRIENQSTAALTVGGVSNGKIDGGNSTATVGGNTTRSNLASQFNDLRSQLDRLGDDSGFNGINLLRGDRLRLSFNETGTSSIDIQAKDADGNVRGISSSELGIDAVSAADFESDENLDRILGDLGNALGELRAQASSFGSNLSSVQNRQDFTKSTINTLRTGADNLTLADINEEAANLLSLQTRQQLSNTALSLSNQADQGVLRLF